MCQKTPFNKNTKEGLLKTKSSLRNDVEIYDLCVIFYISLIIETTVEKVQFSKWIEKPSNKFSMNRTQSVLSINSILIKCLCVGGIIKRLKFL